MRYLLLIYDAESRYVNQTQDEAAADMNGYRAFNEATQAAGQYLGGEALEPTTTATTVRVRNGETVTTDGPFAETKEQLGGFYLIEAKDLDEATALAAKIPAAKNGCVEVRPIMEIVFD